MLLDRIEARLELVVDTPLMIGDGSFRKMPGADGETRTVTGLARGAHGFVIPGTTLKGALRAAAEAGGMAATEFALLFGDIKNREHGIAGRFTVFSAHELAGVSGKRATRKMARTAINRRRGAADENKLFNTEAVSRGTRFATTATLAFDRDHLSRDEAVAQVSRLLSPLAAGIAMGKGTRTGAGQVRIDTCEAESVEFDPQLGFQRHAVRLALGGEPLQKGKLIYRLQLHSLSPFIIQAEDRKTASDGSNVISYLKDENGRIAMLPTSFLGVLRSRAAWLSELEFLRGNTSSVPNDRVLNDAMVADDRDLLAGALGNARAVTTEGDLKKLSSTERLFGVPGWRGLLSVQVRSDVHPGGEIEERTNVAIDRFSGGALRGALFKTETVVGTSWTVEILVDESRIAKVRGGKDLFDQDLRFLQRVIESVERDGLFIGHAAARGYGHFDVEVRKP
jgi:CRISPR/Cas system CSM-associated protein Csm3 (group 7 of RAMP superfamily)